MLYGEDIAFIHDAGFTGFVRTTGPHVLRLLRERNIHRGLVVDLGCGSGQWAAMLLDAGYEVLGVDVSASMIDMARARAPKATFQCASILDVKLPACAAVTVLGEVLSYLDPTGGASDTLTPVFGRVFRALAPGGLFVFDVAEPGRCPEGRRQTHWVRDDWAMFCETIEDPASRELTRRITSFRRIDGTWRRSDEEHRLRLYPRSQVQQALRDVGFCARARGTYGASPAWPGMGVHVAVKPEPT